MNWSPCARDLGGQVRRRVANLAAFLVALTGCAPSTSGDPNTERTPRDVDPTIPSGNGGTNSNPNSGGGGGLGSTEPECSNASDCLAYDDEDACNGSHRCVAGKCEIDPATVVTCPVSVVACMQTVCNPTTGICEHQPLPDGTSCADTNLCNGHERCQAGTCITDEPTVVLCDTSEDTQCTRTVCNPDTGACERVALPDGTSCDDGLYCTASDACAAGACTGAGSPCPAACFDCDEASQGCTVATNLCFIEGTCRAQGELRVAGACEACSPERSQNTWSSLQTGTSCDDGNDCTVGDTCDGSGSCAGAPRPPPTPSVRAPNCPHRKDGEYPGLPLGWDQTPVLRWSAGTDACGAATYRVEVDESCVDANCPFDAPVQTATVSGSAWEPGQDLALGESPTLRAHYWRVRAERAGAASGWSVGRAIVGNATHDLNGDGYSDVVYLRWVNREYSLYLWEGGPNGISPDHSLAFFSPTGTGDPSYGRQISYGDLDADGFDDLIVGAHDHPGIDGTPNLGRYYVHYGSAAGPSTTPDLVVHNRFNRTQGFPLGLISGDFNGNGHDDVVATTGNTSNALFYYPGSASGIATTPENQIFELVGAFASLPRMHSANDVNGDCRSDLVLRSDQPAYAYGRSSGPGPFVRLLPTEAWSSFDLSVAGGSLNGDRFSDVVLKTTSWVDRGRGDLLVYYGPFGSYSNSPVVCSMATREGVRSVLLSSGVCPQAWIYGTTSSGISLAMDGDTDGDGFSDLLVVSQVPERLDVFRGSASGVALSPSYTITDATYYPREVQYAGDVNRDGYDDVLVYSGSLGDLLVYYGGPGGLSTQNRVLLENP